MSKSEFYLSIFTSGIPPHMSTSTKSSSSRLRVHCFSISLDGFGAGPNQTLEAPLGLGGESLHEWFFPTRTFRQMTGEEGGTTGIEEEFAVRGFENIGAWILGRNMFAPTRGE